MKKRILSLLCALLLMVQLTPVTAADTVFFTAVNDDILPLSSTSMPFWTNGYLYVPVSIFTAEKKLGVDASFRADKNTLMLVARKALVFNLDTGSTTDGQGESYPESAVSRNGQVFVPVARVAEFFNLTYRHWAVEPYGYLVRVYGSSAMLPDSLFLDSAPGKISARYNEFNQGSTSPAVEDPPVTITPMEDPVPEGSQSLYLSFLTEDIDLCSSLLDVLDAQGNSRAAFYFPTALLEGAGDLTRRMNATGHTIGLWADGSDGPEAALMELEEGNRRLSRNTGGKTRLAVLENATEQTAAQVSAAGWRVLRPKVDASSRGLADSAAATSVLKRVSAYSGSVTVWLGGNVTPSALRSFTASARSAQSKFLPLTELVQ